MTTPTELQIKNFHDRCEALANTKFVLAANKLTEILRCVAASPAILALFRNSAEGFDYFSAQRKYMLPVEGDPDHAVLTLPENSAERIAFIFCILTDIDNRTANFSNFLETFFPDDDVEESFLRFVAAMIVPLELTVQEMLLPQAGDDFSDSLPTDKRQLFDLAISFCSSEKRELSLQPLNENDRASGAAILEEYMAAIKEGNISTAQALLLGYHYFTMQTGVSKENVMRLFQITEKL